MLTKISHQIHVPVLIDPIAAFLKKNLKGKTVCDATFGEGGYTKRILAELGPLEVYAVDRDPDAYERAKQLPNVTPIHGKFGSLSSLVPKVDCVLFDLGMSSNQIADLNRGFSFKSDNLDMRMDVSRGKSPSLKGYSRDNSITCETIVNNFPQEKIQEIIRELGEDPSAKRIAEAICRYRQKKLIQSGKELADIVASAARRSQIHPATRTFQAFRMYINDELNQLRQGLVEAEKVLKPDGILCVVSFHSLEDRLVKCFLKTCAGKRPDLLVPQSDDFIPSFSLPMSSVIKPSKDEVACNPRARSAKLRFAIRSNSEPMNHLINPDFPLWKKDRSRNIHAMARKGKIEKAEAATIDFEF